MHETTRSQVCLTQWKFIKIMNLFLSAQVDRFVHSTTSFYFFVFIKPFHQHNRRRHHHRQQRTVWESRRKEIRRLASKRHQTWTTRSGSRLIILKAHPSLSVFCAPLGSFNYRDKRIFRRNANHSNSCSITDDDRLNFYLDFTFIDSSCDVMWRCFCDQVAMLLNNEWWKYSRPEISATSNRFKINARDTNDSNGCWRSSRGCSKRFFVISSSFLENRKSFAWFLIRNQDTKSCDF